MTTTLPRRRHVGPPPPDAATLTRHRTAPPEPPAVALDRPDVLMYRAMVVDALTTALPTMEVDDEGAHDHARAVVVVRPRGDGPAVHLHLTDCAVHGEPGIVALEVSRRGLTRFGEWPSSAVGGRAVEAVRDLLRG